MFIAKEQGEESRKSYDDAENSNSSISVHAASIYVIGSLIVILDIYIALMAHLGSNRVPARTSAIRAFLLAPAVTVDAVMAAGWSPPGDVQHDDLLAEINHGRIRQTPRYIASAKLWQRLGIGRQYRKSSGRQAAK